MSSDNQVIRVYAQFPKQWNILDKRAFLVDALTSKGMSGSPVFKRETEDQYSFVGVYSGRVKEGDVELPLGLVWNRETICDTIMGGSRGEI
jgi:hypothetical protein